MRFSTSSATLDGRAIVATALGFLAIALQRFGFGQDGSIQTTTILSMILVVFALFVFGQRVSIASVLLVGCWLLSETNHQSCRRTLRSVPQASPRVIC